MVHVQHVGKNARRGSTLGKGTGQGKLRRILKEEHYRNQGQTTFRKGPLPPELSSSSKGRYDRDFEPKVKRNRELDTPQESPPCSKCGNFIEASI